MEMNGCKQKARIFPRGMAVLFITAIFMIAVLTCGHTWAQTLNIGIATPLTGPAAYLGNNIKNAILMAVDDQNQQGGVTIGGEKYELNPISRDTKKDTIVGKTVAEELIFTKDVKIIAGPFIDDAIGIQRVTESNKVIGVFVTPVLPGLCGPDKPYSFFAGSHPSQMMTCTTTYINHFYPEAKTVVSIAPDVPDTPLWINAAKDMCSRYGLEWLGMEKFPITTVDYTSIVSRALAKKPDIIDTSSSAAVAGSSFALLIKQLREAGFQGIIMVPAPPPDGMLKASVQKEYLGKIITGNVNIESPIIPATYRDLCRRYMKKFETPPNSGILSEFYNVVKPLFESINGQSSMNTTAWMENFANYRWQSIFEKEGRFVGKGVFGINRIALRSYHVSEFIDGELVTRWEAPLLEEFQGD